MTALVISLFVLILLWLLYLCNTNKEFDSRIEYIESVLNSNDARRYKYQLFDKLEEAGDFARSYSELEKLQILLGRVYDL